MIVAYEVDCQPCLRKEGKEVIGPQGAAILRSIANGSSLTRTAKALNISARKARERIRQMEAADGSQLISNRKGSALKLSEQGARLLDIYENHSSAIEEQVRRRFKNPILTVDGILVLEDGIVLVRRGKEPGKGLLALPGGIVEYGETVEQAVRREFLEETGLKTEVVRLLGVYSDPGRDPRGHFISLVFQLRGKGGKLRGGDDAADALVLPIEEARSLAFDHESMIRDFLQTEHESRQRPKRRQSPSREPGHKK